jgi:DNA-binding transcriptional LysR family regulator
MFVAVYQERSFTAAAQRMHATQSGVSMQIKELEKDLRIALLERSAKGVFPTTAGDRFYRHALTVLRELDEARREMQALQGMDCGSIDVGLMPTFSRTVLSAALNDFELTHPLVKIRVIEAYSAILTECVVREDLDFAIVPPGKPDPRLKTEFVTRDRELFVTRAGGALKHLDPVAIRQLPPLRLIVPTHGNARRDRLDAYLSASGAQIEAIMEMDAMMGTLEVIAGGNWSAILPATLCHPDRAGGLRSLHPIVDPPLFVDYLQIGSAARSMGESAAAFAAILRRHSSRIAAEWTQPQGPAAPA